MLISGFGNGYLHDLSDLSGMAAGQILTVTVGNASSIPPPGFPVPQTQTAAQRSPTSPGVITKEALSAALFAATRPKSQEEIERQRGIQEMQGRILSGAQHVMIYENPQVARRPGRGTASSEGRLVTHFEYRAARRRRRRRRHCRSRRRPLRPSRSRRFAAAPPRARVRRRLNRPPRSPARPLKPFNREEGMGRGALSGTRRGLACRRP